MPEWEINVLVEGLDDTLASCVEVDEDDLRQVAHAVLQAEQYEQAQLTVVITDDEQVAQLNQSYRGEFGPTDVLSFRAQTDTPGFATAAENAHYLGDVIIAYPYAAAQAARAGHSTGDELRLLVVHGVLHLLGYDHHEPEQARTMWARQNTILSTYHASTDPHNPPPDHSTQDT